MRRNVQLMQMYHIPLTGFAVCMVVGCSRASLPGRPRRAQSLPRVELPILGVAFGESVAEVERGLSARGLRFSKHIWADGTQAHVSVRGGDLPELGGNVAVVTYSFRRDRLQWVLLKVRHSFRDGQLELGSLRRLWQLESKGMMSWSGMKGAIGVRCNTGGLDNMDLIVARTGFEYELNPRMEADAATPSEGDASETE